MEFRTLRADEIECRVGRATSTGAQLLLYKDARCDMNILDETVCPANWQRKHDEHKGNLFCSVGINANYKTPDEPARWIWKEDAGVESNTEAEKGHASDSFKRACVNWGIGRELYTAPFIWVAGCTEQDEKSHKWVCRKRFTVSSITYDDKRRIVALEIKSGTDTVYTVGQKVDSAAPKPQTRKASDEITIPCADCGEIIKSYLDGNGKLVSHTRLSKATMESFGRPLCKDCATKAAESI